MKNPASVLFVMAAFASSLGAQINDPITPAQRTRQAYLAKPPEYAIGVIPSKPTKISVLRGRVLKVDAATRSLTIESEAGPLTVSFAQPQGLEAIHLSKHLGEQGGTPQLPFEDLRVGWQVKVCLYPRIGVISELTVLERQ